ncbi:hypothetical protein BGZ76_004799 [Entomortierella beljakovae]|nr:hypothetical protein BGZ76_004799 [Entomortierella beljakovae]
MTTKASSSTKTNPEPPSKSIADSLHSTNTNPEPPSKSIAGSLHSSSTSQSLTTSNSDDSVSPSLISQLSTRFKKYEGEPWLLTSGTNVDDVLYQHVKTLTKVSALHHFVLDQINSILCLFNQEDRDMLQQFISKRDSSSDKSIKLCSWKKREIRQYELAPNDIWTLLERGSGFRGEVYSDVNPKDVDTFRKSLFHAMLDITTVYRNSGNKLPLARLEIWYRTKVWGFLANLIDAGGILEFGPGDVMCTASSTMNNVERDLESKYRQGGKLDSVIICSTTRLELCAIEAGRWDSGATGTKVLQDRRKLAKVLKDMFEVICNRSQRPDDVRMELRTYALLISGALLITMIFTFKKRLELMSAKVIKWTQVYQESESTTEIESEI